MRVIRLYPGFPRARARFGISEGSPLARRIVREIALLATADALPLDGDTKVLMPPTMFVYGHAIAGTSLTIVYWPEHDELRLITLKLNDPS